MVAHGVVSRSRPRCAPPLRAAAVAVLALAAVGLVGCTERKAAPEPLDDATYDRVVGLFYAGLGALDSGVQNELAASLFTTVTQLAPHEPAAWANLAVTRLRMQQNEAAAEALAQGAADVADSRLTFIEGLIASRSGQAEAALAAWRRAVEQDPNNLQAQYALVQELARQTGTAAEAELRERLGVILAADPGNLKALLDSARAAARAGDAAALTAALDAVAARTDELVASVSPDQPQVATDLPPLIAELQAGAKGDLKALASQLAVLDNLSRATEAFRVDLAKLASSDQAIGQPIPTFLVLPVPRATPAEADGTVTFAVRVVEGVGAAAGVTATAGTTVATGSATTFVRAMAVFTDAPPVVATIADGQLVLHAKPALALPSPRGGNVHVALPVDANGDGRTDVVAVGTDGLQLWQQVTRGRFEDVTASMGVSESVVSAGYRDVRAFDLDLDGDLDLAFAPYPWSRIEVSNPLVLQNDGDGTWSPAPDTGLVVTREEFVQRSSRSLFLPGQDPEPTSIEAWLDVDADGVNDIIGDDGTGHLSVWRNLRGGRYAEMDLPHAGAEDGLVLTGPHLADEDHDGRLERVAAGPPAVAVADVDRDGRLDVIAAGPTGLVAYRARGADGALWTAGLITATTYSSATLKGPPGVWAGDLDDNGAGDLVAFDGSASHAWLGGAAVEDWTPLALPEGFRVTDIADLDADHRLDLLGVDAAGRPVVLMNQGGQKAYHAVTLQARAAQAADQRINSFAVGGAVEARSGRLTQKVPIDGPFIHLGLGDRATAELVRFTWPNGTIQPEFDVAVDTPVVVEQRLKGSCPWLYAWDGTRMAFVTDVLWKSPLGLRLNAQDTAGVVTTRDWVKVPGDRLAPRTGGDAGRAHFDLRVTGELWETHYWDHFGLLAVDHAPDVEVWVDERFVVPPAPLAVQATGPVQAVAAAVDHRARDVADIVAARDDAYLDTFALGAYQGLAEDHWVELAIDPAAVGGDLTNAVVVAQGWLYPTDSSINVALGQGAGPKPQALSLETLDGQGGWTVVEPFLGFPAGKGKTMLIDLAKLADAARDDDGRVRLRLRTSMEIYWDRLGVAQRRPADAAAVTTATLRSAVMGYHGFSTTNQYARGVQGPGAAPRSQPDTPDYDRIAATVPIWLDLAGWYTRYGPVEALLAAVDDRYVIVNAGDEVRLTFDAVAPPAAGMERDYVFISDGWNKDGDFNTAYSGSVHPLPSHDNPKYVDQRAYGAAGALTDDPVYRAHADDWATYHTRYVSPLPVQRALWEDER